MLRRIKGKNAVGVTANNTQKRHFLKLLADNDIKGCKVETLHAAIGYWPSGRETVESLTQKIMPAVGVSLRPKAKIALSRNIWIIDEICMDSPEMLDLAEAVARRVRGNDAPFGGIQIVGTGDVSQLPAQGSLVDDGEAPKVAQTRPQRELAVESRIFGLAGGIEVIVFDKVVRQRDTRMMKALSDLSVGDASEAAWNLVQVSRDVKFDSTVGVMNIFATNAEVLQWGAAGVRERGGSLVQEWQSVVRVDGELLVNEALDPDALKRFQGKLVLELSIAVGERYLIGSLPTQWKISKWDYATVGEVVEVMSVDVARSSVKVRFLYRQFNWHGEQYFVESFVPLMTWRAQYDGKQCVSSKQK